MTAERDALLVEIAGIRPTVFWQVVNADESGICIEFSSRDTFHPEEDCREWIAKQPATWIAHHGYHARRVERYTRTEELAREAAAALAQRPPREPRQCSVCDELERIPAECWLCDAPYAAPTGIPRDDARDKARLDWLESTREQAESELGVTCGWHVDETGAPIIRGELESYWSRTLRGAIDAAMTSESGEQKSADAALHEPTPTEQPAVPR